MVASSMEALIDYAIRQATRFLREKGEIPVFAGILDDGVPAYLNIHVKDGYELPTSVAGLAEFVRFQLQQTGSPGVLFCAPVRVPADDGTEWDGFRIHADNVADDHATLVVVRYLVDEQGQLHLDKPARGKTEDRILAP